MLKTITSTANTVGSLEYKGLWNAATNTPTLVSSVGTQGDYYVVSVAGTTNLDGVTTWDEGDWAIFNGSVWQLFQDGQDGVFATLTVSGEIAANGGIALGDNDKATFGASDDLQIYHDGSNSRIYDTGTGDLRIQGTNLRLMDANGANYLYAVQGSDVTLYHNNSAKLSTTATGIDISGTATMDGLVVDGVGRIEETGAAARLTIARTDAANSAESASLDLMENNAANLSFGDVAAFGYRLEVDGSTNKFNILSGNQTVTRKRFSIDRDTGNVSLYEDTGTTPKFFWDASAESLGIGTSSPTFGAISTGIEVEGTTAGIRLQGATTGALELYHNNGLSTIDSRTATGGSNIAFKTENTERVRITSGGLVGIGTSSPAQAKLDILLESDYSSHTGHGLSILSNAADAYTSLYIGTDDTVDSAYIQSAGKNTSFTSKKLLLNPNGGNVGIGTAPASVLDVSGEAPTLTLRDSRTGGSWTAGTALGKLDFYTSDSSGIGAHSIASIGVVAGGVNAASPDGELVFATGGYNAVSQERARLTSDGNFLVGTTSYQGGGGSGAKGFYVGSDGLLSSARSNATVAVLNRTTSDGDIVEFRQSGTTVGSIGNNTDFYIASQDGTGLRFTSNQVLPCSESGAIQNGSRDLGSSSGRFKDLYLSGGVYLGGTGAANLLDDYETGSWTPVYTADSGAATYNVQTGSYVKVGKLVTVIGELQASRNTLSGAVTITGLPFASSGNGGGFNPTFTIRFASDMPNLKGYTSASSIVLKKQATSSTNSVDVIETDLSNTATNYNYLYFTATYMTA
jgi:hypothetical protein